MIKKNYFPGKKKNKTIKKITMADSDARIGIWLADLRRSTGKT